MCPSLVPLNDGLPEQFPMSPLCSVCVAGLDSGLQVLSVGTLHVLC